MRLEWKANAGRAWFYGGRKVVVRPDGLVEADDDILEVYARFKGTRVLPDPQASKPSIEQPQHFTERPLAKMDADRPLELTERPLAKMSDDSSSPSDDLSPPADDLDGLTVKELKAKARKLGLEVPKRIKRDDLVELIQGAG